MDDLTHKQLFIDSLIRCKASGNFIQSFYDRFLQDEQIAVKFRDTDFGHQTRMLERSLELVAGATCGDLESLQELRERARTHDRDHLNIKPAMYNTWINDLVATARACDNAWDAQTEEAWNAILHFAVNRMVRRY